MALPHGTEVVTRVDRVLGERRIPQGALPIPGTRVGRVTRTDGDAVDVTVVGVGVVRYARAELSARRIGQALFAQRRADAWEALRPCLVLETSFTAHPPCWPRECPVQVGLFQSSLRTPRK